MEDESVDSMTTSQELVTTSKNERSRRPSDGEIASDDDVDEAKTRKIKRLKSVDHTENNLSAPNNPIVISLPTTMPENCGIVVNSHQSFGYQVRSILCFFMCAYFCRYR